MPEKQLNVWIAEDLRNYVAQRAEQEKCGMNKIIAELICGLTQSGGFR